MNRVPVVSSDVASVGFDEGSSVLEIEFHSGGIYQYQGVPIQHFLAMTGGVTSVGRYFHREIKNRYGYERVT
jgi:hypothetical protein